MPCSCGLPSAEQCSELFHASSTRELEDFRYAKVHRLKVDAYCLQHPDAYLVSPKSFAAHLVGMCIAMEQSGNPFLLKALSEEWLDGKVELQKPPMLSSFGNMTIADVMQATDASEYEKLVRKWAESVWQAYGAYHELAREWLQFVRKSAEQKHR